VPVPRLPPAGQPRGDGGGQRLRGDAGVGRDHHRVAAGRDPARVPMPEPMPTNICFGGDGMRTAFVTFRPPATHRGDAWTSPAAAALR
jgi:hypothetical protein